jgi:hypothetical protein
MNPSYWHRQTTEPLYPELQWSRPENKQHAGKLLIVGGNEHGFAAPAAAYNQALQAGAGSVRVVLPDKLHKTVAKIFPEAEYAPSTPSGSFAVSALAELLAAAAWADGTLLAGNVGHNSETAILLESLTGKYQSLLTISGDAIEQTMGSCLTRPNTLFVLNFSQLQKLAQALHSTTPATSGMSLLALVDLLHHLTKSTKWHLITEHAEHIFVASAGQVSTTKLAHQDPTTLAARASVWWLQNPAKPFEALTTAAFEAATP